MPLLYATLFPVAGFVFGVARKRTADIIALIALAGIAIHLVVTVLSPDVGTALILRSFQGAAIGLGFLASVALRRPIILYAARQFVAAGGAERRARFDVAVAQDRGRTFAVATIVWGVALVLMSGAHVVLAVELPHDQFILLSPILGVVTDLVLIAWSIRYMFRRMSAYLRPPHPTLSLEGERVEEA